jgi:ribosome-binding protein aMBF1 (putative translation factor)
LSFENDHLNELERGFIGIYGTYGKGYNATPGGEGMRWQVSAEVRTDHRAYELLPDIEKFAVRIKRLREANNWSQSDLTWAAGLTHGLVSRLEDGIGSPSFKTMDVIAVALGVTISELLDEVC